MKHHLIPILSIILLVGCSIENPQQTYVIPEPNGKIKIASFNIQVFGESKSSDIEIMNILKQIIKNFDIVAIQEIRDKSGNAISSLNNLINEDGISYNYIISSRLGRSSSKEQYAFIYNTNTITYTGNSYVYQDNNDIFEREPFVASFKSGSFDFTLINIHVKPEDAYAEIRHLETVFNNVGAEDIILLGDLNADCSYFKSDNTIFSDDIYYWIIKTDTTTKTTNCAYDRIIFKKATTSEDYTSQSDVFYFDKEYNLNQDITQSVSDHYPIWAEFYT